MPVCIACTSSYKCFVTLKANLAVLLNAFPLNKVFLIIILLLLLLVLLYSPSEDYLDTNLWMTYLYILYQVTVCYYAAQFVLSPRLRFSPGKYYITLN